VPCDELLAVPAGERVLVHLEPDPVSEAVVEALVEDLARLLRELGGMAGLGEHFAGEPVELLTVHAWPDCGVDQPQGLEAEPVKLDQLSGRLAEAERAR